MNTNQKDMWDILKGYKTIRKEIHTLKPDNEISSGLRCPRCDCTNMHHIGVELFNRREDAKHGDHILIYVPESHGWEHNEKIPENIVDGDISGNPSSRRSGIVIKMACEECGHLDLCIIQNRGYTELEWRYKEQL
jgi:hypothetical protein